MLKLTKALFLNTLRDFGSSFWLLVFPIILYLILSSIFGNIGSNNIQLKMGLVVEDELKGMGKIIEGVLSGISGENGPFKKVEFKNLNKALKELENGKLDVVLLIPKDTSKELSSSILLGNLKFAKIQTADIKAFYAEERAESRVAVNILRQIFNRVNLEIVKRMKKTQYVDFKVTERNVQVRKFNYNLYLLPGVLIMAILTTSIFSFPLGFTEMKEKGITKRIYSSPVSAIEYFFSFFFAMLCMVFISILLLFMLTTFIYRLDTRMFSSSFLFLLLFSTLVLFSFGMMVASFVRRSSTATAIANILNYVMMFLGGLFFPVFNFPWSLRWITYSIPTTYLVESLRKIIGYNVSNLSWSVLIGVPILWFAISLTVFIINFKKVMGHD